MSSINRKAVEQAFETYTRQYQVSDPKIRLKIDHTYRVAGLCERIAETIPGSDKNLCWLSGMLHDIGRFEQVRRYNTFSDADSVDHAAFGADLLFQEKLLDSFGTFEQDHVEILETAIRNHNRFRIDDAVKEPCRTYCNILRDADKIDILRVNYETPFEDIYNVPESEMKQAAVSDAVKQNFLEGHAILRSVRKTPADTLVSHISLVHELVFPISIRIVKEQGYLDKLLAFQSENEETVSWFTIMRETLAAKQLI